MIVPTYQCAAYLPRALESVLTQTYATRRTEIIVIDDGSTDATEAVVQPYLGSIRYLRQENRGPAAARNTGVSASHGDLITFLDADDYWFPQRLERLVDAFSSEKDAILQNDYFLERDGRRAPQPRFGNRMPPQFFAQAQEQYHALLSTLFCLPAKALYPRKAFADVGRFDAGLRYHEDLDFALRCAAAGYAFRIVSEPLEVYTIRPGSITDSRRIRWYSDLLRVHLKHADAVDPERLSQLIASTHYHAALTSARKREWAAAVRSALKAARHFSYLKSVIWPEMARRFSGRSTREASMAWRKI